MFLIANADNYALILVNQRTRGADRMFCVDIDTVFRPACGLVNARCAGHAFRHFIRLKLAVVCSTTIIITEKEMKMAQIITLKEIQNRDAVLRGQSVSSKGIGPAQLLFFTGVRYERYEVSPTDPHNFEPAKFAPKRGRKRASQH